MTLNESQAKLAAACYAHLPDLSGIWFAIFSDGHAHHIDVSTESAGQVAYSPDGVSADDHKRRRRLTLGRYLARQHDVTIDSAIEKGINKIVADMLLASGVDTSAEFKVLRGDAITEAYCKRVGGGSCMAGEDNREISEWYAIYPDKLGLVVWRETEGRALLWTTDSGELALDRIYAGNQELARERYAAWCQENGVNAAYDNLPGLSSIGSRRATLGDKAVDGRPVPYLDTFMYASTNGIFGSYPFNGYEYECQNTDGSLGEEGRITCECCGDRCHEDDACSIPDGYACESCYLDNYSHCERCQETVANDDTCEVDGQTWCEYCRNSRAVECARCEQYTNGDNACSVSGESWCQSCFENHATCCDKCSDCVPCDDTREIDSETWCEPCADSHAKHCTECKAYFSLDDLSEVDGQHYCDQCEPETDDLLTVTGA